MSHVSVFAPPFHYFDANLRAPLCVAPNDDDNAKQNGFNDERLINTSLSPKAKVLASK